jgi:signal transduction histidine kinase
VSRKQITLLTLLVCVPLAALVWLGGRLARDERARLRRDLQDLLAEQLGDANQIVDRFFQKRQRELLRVTDLATFETGSLRATVRSDPHLLQLFVLEPEGEILHPPLAGPLNQSEREFLERARVFLQDKDLIRAADLQTESAVDQVSGFSDSASTATHGWYAWYWGRGVHLIFWRRLPTGHIVGAELDRARWIADLIAELPQTPQATGMVDSGPAAQSRIQLVDSHDDTIYQWGAFEPPPGATPFAEQPASAPLSAWRFKFFVAEDRFAALAGRSAYFNLIAGLSAIGVVLLTLAGFFYRESSRELREAATRVNFVNQVSHELKTPLTNIRMYAELLAEQLQDGENGETDDEADAQRRLSIIISESGRLSRLIGNVLTFAQQQRRQIELNLRPGRIDDTIHAVIQQFQPTLQSQGVVPKFVAGAGAVVNFDADAVEQILVNLFNNVEKYAVQGKRLDITSRHDGERTTILVSDAGPGVPPAERDRIFQPFYRISHRLEGPAGAGIGLSIARGLARLHGGDLRLVDSADGATFEVDLHTPLAKSPQKKLQEGDS